MREETDEAEKRKRAVAAASTQQSVPSKVSKKLKDRGAEAQPDSDHRAKRAKQQERRAEKSGNIDPDASESSDDTTAPQDGGDGATQKPDRFFRVASDLREKLKPASGNWRDVNTITTFSFGFGGFGGGSNNADNDNNDSSDKDNAGSSGDAAGNNADDATGKVQVASGNSSDRNGHARANPMVSTVTKVGPTVRSVLSGGAGASGAGASTSGASTAVSTAAAGTAAPQPQSFFFADEAALAALVKEQKHGFSRTKSAQEVRKAWESNKDRQLDLVRRQKRDAVKRKRRSGGGRRNK